MCLNIEWKQWKKLDHAHNNSNYIDTTPTPTSCHHAYRGCHFLSPFPLPGHSSYCLAFRSIDHVLCQFVWLIFYHFSWTCPPCLFLQAIPSHSLLNRKNQKGHPSPDLHSNQNTPPFLCFLLPSCTHQSLSPPLQKWKNQMGCLSTLMNILVHIVCTLVCLHLACLVPRVYCLLLHLLPCS